ncbi:MAG: serine/threonine-protein kinase, partial [Chthoniobacteraceae bacterium]|nr:serine/threonine-protein kinase [Chthoniobacteraceae bacterium]
MSHENQCPECGAKLPAETPEGLCPACLLRRGLETQAAGSAPDIPSPAPEALASYFPQLEIVELLGRGGMGAVYKARHRGLDRWVALKILPAATQRDPAFAERFTREARALAKLDHPNIVTVYDSGEADGLFYFVMEFVDGANLRQVLASGGVTPEQALAIVPQICDALQYAHKAGIVHRDIKPENILVDKSGRVKIADFGIAKIVGKEARDFTLTSMGDVMGTPAYMAPEQVEHPSEVDHRADIYSLGVVFYQMLTGELPLGRFAPPSRKVHIDVRLDEVVLRALEKEPDRRYQQAGEVKTEVETIAGTPGSAGTEKPKAYPWNGPVNYRSKATLFGLPLVHITQGTDPNTGRKLVARGIIAIGDIAQGVIAIGGCAMGGIALGGAAFGVFSVGGLALGLWAFAGLALGLISAWGGFALAPIAMGGTAMGYFANGGRAWGMHVWDSITKDPVAVRFFQDSWSQKFLDWMPIARPILGFAVFVIAWGAIEWA